MKLLDGARTAIKTCLNVKPNEKVLILTDTGRNPSIAKALFEAAIEANSNPVITVMTRRNIGEEPPPHVVEAMKASDAIACPTSTSMYHTNARMVACEAGARIIAMTGSTRKTLTSGPITADFIGQRPKVEKLAKLMTDAKTITLTTPLGTKLTANIEGRIGNAETGLCHERGRCVGVPNIEANIAPVEETTDGKLVVDATISVIPGIVRKRVELKIEGGRAKEITGGREALKLREILEKTNDPNSYIVAEIGVGLNPKAKVRGVIIEDEASLGTAHVALGDNHRMGGKNTASTHIDMVIRKPTIELDGNVVYKVNKLLA
jgi:leucyl aminopeptidase (aminopeptidase T)